MQLGNVINSISCITFFWLRTFVGLNTRFPCSILFGCFAFFFLLQKYEFPNPIVLALFVRYSVLFRSTRCLIAILLFTWILCFYFKHFLSLFLFFFSGIRFDRRKKIIFKEEKGKIKISTLVWDMCLDRKKCISMHRLWAFLSLHFVCF